MAEAVGVVIGVAGLAGVLNACLEALSLFHAGQTFGRDLEILLTKLDIEKTLLLHWAERIGLAAFQDGRSTHDTRLNDPRTYTAVVNTLSSVLYLLTDSEQLRSRYGAIQSSEITCIQKIDIVSSNRMVNFVRSYQQRLAKIGKRQDDSKAWTRAKWAIRDKDKFYTLVKELGDFIRYLNELLPGQDHQQRLIHEDINRIARDVRSLRLVQQATVQDYRDWADAASSYAGMSDLCSEELQRIEDWRDDIPNFLGEGPTFPPGIKQENSTREKDPEGFPEAAIGPPLLPGVKQENFTREKDPEDFRKAAIGPTEALVQLCQSNKYTVRRTDNNGHTLLRVYISN